MTKIIRVPIENHILDTHEFKYFADYFRKSYEEFMGVSTNEIKYNIYTLDEQIDRYAKNITFWYLQLDKLTNNKSHKNKIMKMKFIKSQIDRIMNASINIFPNGVAELINEKALLMKQLYS